jgi:L-ascorbate metabolism protein UlaG (beta-lactamase superfamily)
VVNNGDLYTIEKLQPRVVIPMHRGGGEDLNQRFANEVAAMVGSSDLVAARRPGDRYFYSNGRIGRPR